MSDYKKLQNQLNDYIDKTQKFDTLRHRLYKLEQELVTMSADIAREHWDDINGPLAVHHNGNTYIIEISFEKGGISTVRPALDICHMAYMESETQEQPDA